MFRRSFQLISLIVLFGGGWIADAETEPVFLPNASFELPVTTNFMGFPVSLNIEFWEKFPKAEWYDESTRGPWNQLTGIFKNSSTNSPDHIDNCDGNQAMWLFTPPGAGVFQDFDSVDYNDPEPSHGFDALYELGSSYQLTVGVIGGGGGMFPGATLELSFFFRDENSNQITVATTVVTNSLTIFSNNTHLIDFIVSVPPISADDPWLGKHMGIRMMSTAATNLIQGYWDLDNVRLVRIPPPRLVASSVDGLIQLSVISAAGSILDILATTNATSPIASWNLLGSLTNTTGVASFVDTETNLFQRYYRARQWPSP